ncbi:hypothetical protein ACFRFH_11930 [Leifsonia sp. NPDC056824]|uniref:hypothetical protein n=1 Tax=Leifsonia sp. NPDC056824 TaxID=3345953 RepID=UPI0036C09536
MATTETVEDVALAPGDEVDVPCEIRSPRTCKKPALWWFVCRVCSVPTSLCETHKKNAYKLVALAGYVPLCERCTNTGEAVDEVWRVIPIGAL